MKIGVLYEFVDGGGAPLVVRNQIRHLMERHHEVTFMTTPREVERARILFTGARCIPLLGHPLSKFLGPLWSFFIVAAILLSRSEIVIIHSMRTASYIGFFAILCGCRVIVVEHANPNATSSLLSGRQRRFLDFVLNHSTAVCVSHGSAQAFSEVFGVDAHVIYNFTDFDQVENQINASRREKTIVFLGRLEREKGPIKAIESFEKVAPHCNWRLEIYGDGTEVEHLKRSANNSMYRERIKFGGWACDPRGVLEKAGIFVVTSRYEGFGIALVEAMSLGTPCVSFDCPFGPREIIENGRSGILVKNGDVEELAEAVLGLIGNPKLRKELGIAAIRRSAEFNKSSHNFAWDRLIDSGCVTRQKNEQKDSPIRK
jgi:glycosyltransferase involved in cell wall biosynthesis